MKRNSVVFQSRLMLILLGLSLGYIGRMLFGAPADEAKPSFDFGPIPSSSQPESDSPPCDVPVVRPKSEDVEEPVGGIVAPFEFPTHNTTASIDRPLPISFPGEEFAHDATAAFHAHGEQLCASGCATSHHPTRTLTQERFFQLRNEYLIEPMDSTNNALEELLYYGRQTRQFIDQFGLGEMSPARSEFLLNELKTTHVQISIRVKDEHGTVRTWLEPTRVPFDRRHVFEMKTQELQPLVTSGTIKRVGLKHLWTRL